MKQTTNTLLLLSIVPILTSTTFINDAEASQVELPCTTMRTRLFDQNWQTLTVRAAGIHTFEFSRGSFVSYNFNLSRDEFTDLFLAFLNSGSTPGYRVTTNSYFDFERDNNPPRPSQVEFELYRDASLFVFITEDNARRTLRDTRCYELITGPANTEIHYVITGRMEYTQSGLKNHKFWTILLNN